MFSIIGVLFIPHIWCMAEVPNYMTYIKATPAVTLFCGALAGFFWGISSIWYSKSIDMIGVSLVTGINLGLSNLLGSFVPMIILGTYPSAKVMIVLLLGQAILLAGVVVLSKAGFMKNGDTAEKKEQKKAGSSVFVTGLIMALASGAGSAAINILGCGICRWIFSKLYLCIIKAYKEQNIYRLHETRLCKGLF